MKEKKFNVDECNDVGTLKGRIMFLESNMEGLSRQIGGYKTANENYRKQVSELKERVKHYKALGIEGDELYEKKTAECEEKDKVIDGLSEQVKDLSQKIKKSCDTIFGQKKEIEELNEQILMLKRPWWKKIFTK